MVGWGLDKNQTGLRQAKRLFIGMFYGMYKRKSP